MVWRMAMTADFSALSAVVGVEQLTHLGWLTHGADPAGRPSAHDRHGG
jgi:hypothetical protein